VTEIDRTHRNSRAFDEGTHGPFLRPTIMDVAHLARASVGTVSNVLNENRKVSAGRRRAVMDAVEALRFQPNRSARALVAHRQKSQGVLPDGGPRLVCVGQVCVEHVISLPRIPAPGLRTTSRTMFKTPGGHAATVAVFAAGVGAPFAVASDLVTGLCDDDESTGWSRPSPSDRST